MCVCRIQLSVFHCYLKLMYFFLDSLKILSLSLEFSVFTMISQRGISFYLSCVGSSDHLHLACWFCKCFGKSLAMISLNIISSLFSSPPPSGSPVTHILHVSLYYTCLLCFFWELGFVCVP